MCFYFKYIFLITGYYFQVSIGNGATAMVDLTNDAGEDQSDGEELSIKPSNVPPWYDS